MSVSKFGRVTPLQSDMLNIGGVLSGVPEEFLQPNDQIKAMKKARANLVLKTGMDFGYDLGRWHDFLIKSDAQKREYKFHYSWVAVSGKIEELLNDEIRLRLVDLANEPESQTDF